MKEMIVLGVVAGLYTAARDYVKVQSETLYKYPYILDAVAIGSGYFLTKKIKTVGTALLIAGVGNTVKDLIYLGIRKMSQTGNE